MRDPNQLLTASPETSPEVAILQVYAEIINPQIPEVMLLGLGAIAIEKSLEAAAED